MFSAEKTLRAACVTPNEIPRISSFQCPSEHSLRVGRLSGTSCLGLNHWTYFVKVILAHSTRSLRATYEQVLEEERSVRLSNLFLRQRIPTALGTVLEPRLCAERERTSQCGSKRFCVCEPFVTYRRRGFYSRTVSISFPTSVTFECIPRATLSTSDV